MMKRVLIAFVTALSIGSAALAQSEGGYAIRGTQTREREALASAATAKQANQPVGEIFPNPTSDGATLSLNINAAGKIVFYNLLGTPVSSQEFGKDVKTVTLDFSNFAEGVYFGIVTSNNKTVATRRISIKR